MKSKTLAATLLALILTLTASPLAATQTTALAQTTASAGGRDWQGLSTLKPGKKILVEFKSGVGDPVEGRFVSAVGSRLTLKRDGIPVGLEQRDIQSVYRLKGRWSRGTLAKVGAGIGMVVGTFVGVAIEVRNEERPGHVPSADDDGPAIAGAFLGTLAGAGAGALLGGKRKGQLLYEAK